MKKLRVASHRLEIEVGRWARPYRVPIDERKCRFGNTLEDEFHFLLECNLYRDLRMQFITRIDVYETLCPQQMLVHKGGKIKNWSGECRDVTPTKSLSQNIRIDVNREVKFL